MQEAGVFCWFLLHIRRERQTRNIGNLMLDYTMHVMVHREEENENENQRNKVAGAAYGD